MRPSETSSRPSPATGRVVAGAFRTIPLALVLGLTSTAGLADEDYQIEINGNRFAIGLDQEKTLVLPGGQNLSIILSLNEYISFEGSFFSFSHKNQFKPNRTDLGDGIFQTVITTPLGSAVLIQEYTNIDPTSLVGLMLKEITKEEVEYGYKYEERDVSRMVGNIEITGKEATTTYKDQRWTRAVYTYGKKDSGVLIVTSIEADSVASDAHLISDLWETLRIGL